MRNLFLLGVISVYLLVLLKLIVFKDFTYLYNLYSTNHYLYLFKLSVKRANFIPFNTFYYYLSGEEDFKTGLENLGGNILLFIPSGILFPLINNKLKTLKTFLLLIFMISLFFECSQLVLGYGSCDVDDIILNVLGGLIGFILFKIVKKLFPHKRSVSKISST